jgi:succinate dehydrogenase / fumarate reductase cytochrome b subunit
MAHKRGGWQWRQVARLRWFAALTWVSARLICAACTGSTKDGEFMAQGGAPNRPLSPHLQIWRFTVTMAASITHRFTGVALYTGTILLALWLFAATQSPGFFGWLSAILTSPLGMIVLAGYVWALCFHSLNGLRHLYWDSGRGLAVRTATMTAWMVYGGSVALTILVIWAGLSARGGA